jgi:hypothetical protein
MEGEGPNKLMRMIIIVLPATATACHGQLRLPFPINDNCPVKVKGPTAAFDIEHDKDTVGNGSLFCRLGVTASHANRAISDFQMAVVAPDKFPPDRIVKFPVEIVVYGTTPDGKRKDSTLSVRTRAEWAEFVRLKLNDRQRAAIEAAKLSDMLIVNSQAAGPGFILGDGLVFFSTRNANRITVWHLNTEVLGD